jgi:ABC-type bacteriocin/lantibiotic exporter with double-glycine peptidase domain
LVLGVGAVALVYYFVVRRSVQIASTLRQVDIVRYRLLFSIATAIRDIKIMGLEGLFEQRNSHVSGHHARLGGRLNLYNTLPRMLVEFFALLAIVVLSLTVVLLEMPMTEAGPLLGLIVIATLRAIPSFSRLMASLNVFGGSGQYVRMLMDLRAKLVGEAVVRQHDHLEFTDAIELKNVSFRYGSKDVLVDIGLRLGRNESIGIVGSSGAGKTTLLDIFTGLQQATSGEFTCDGVRFNPFTSHAMQSLIGYVPQSITLLDESIAFNVSFEEVPDVERVMRALTSANLLDLVTSLPEGIQTRVGENGLRISGGQRQRVGIARALYRLPEILVFDEATSSLDAISESELVSEIEKLRGRASIVIVAHRLSTVMSCDRIYVLSGGRIEASGSHEQLLRESETYRRLYASQG